MVAECTTISTPKSEGFWKNGDMNVLSAIVSNPCCFATATMAAISVICNTGLDGVSIYSALVAGVIAAVTAATSLKSTKYA